MNDHIQTIASRATAIFRKANGDSPAPAVIAGLIKVAHDRRPLRLAEMAEADDLNLIHDVAGIINHMDFATGEMRDCFLPRFTATEAQR